jgi:hypothetical protein
MVAPISSPTLASLVAKFKHWLAAQYSQQEIEQLCTDDAGYPGWAEIDKYFAFLLAHGSVASLSYVEQLDLLYLIARNWDIGTMIAWLSPHEGSLSNDGFLKPEHFLRLATTLTTLTQAEFRDAKYQFAVAGRKFGVLSLPLQQILLNFFDDPDEYVKTSALATLGKLGYPDLPALLEQAWEVVQEEHSKVACLSVVAQYSQDKALLRRYLTLAATLPGAYLADYVAAIREELF